MCGEHQTELRRGAIEAVDDREHERNRQQSVAEGRGRLAQPEQPEARLAKSAKRV